jgi:hypothetical protein
MSLKRTALVLAVLAACSSSETTATSPPAVVSTTQCSASSKACGGACVTTALPELGCAEAACSPCVTPHASATCSPDGKCAAGVCENGFGDCNRVGADGCEVDVTTADANCGACGVACAPTQVCRKSTCIARDAAEAQTWLATKDSGWCFESYNQLINLCGDVDFCFDKRFMREYPTGFGVDIAFDFEKPLSQGTILALGGDCAMEGLQIDFTEGSTVRGTGFGAGLIQVGITPGKHLVSYQVTPTGSALYLDGVRAGVGTAPLAALKLRDSCGPGLVVGGRISYWWEAPQKAVWPNMAPFFVQLREGVADANVYSVARATAAGPGTVLLFDQAGAVGASWTAATGGLVGVAKNSLSGDPELDAAASGPLPTWKPFAQCALR